MQRSLVRMVGALTIMGAIASCGDDAPAAVEEVESFIATLTGTNEVPSNASTASGVAEISIVGPTLLYRIDVTGLSNPSAAHIHGPADPATNAGVRVNLCGATGVPACPVGAPFSGVLTAGSATQVSGISFDSLVALLRNGNSYVNVHTNDGAGATNTGPGDLSAGELRGQVMVAP